MKLKDIKKLLGNKISIKKIKEITSKITPAEFKKEMNKKDGSIIKLIKTKIK